MTARAGGPAMAAGPVERLSPREREVLALAAEGLANKEIARRLDPPVSEDTVKKHLHSVYMKWNVQSRTKAVVIWLECQHGRNS
ncbi:MAG: helix-turn-helix transcriptional regulator [Dehalococcoidia bacterium]|nr:helix-turn-helix transcriptional regulator [Dehalococcoidia bacterium]